MKNYRLLQLLFAFAIVGVSFSSCKKDEVTFEEKIEVDYHNIGGFYITNEGQFQHANGSISYYNSEKDWVVNNVFKLANGHTIGDVVQSLTVVGKRAVICVNASDKIIITNADDMKQLFEIAISKPRYAVKIDDNTAMVSSWSNKVFVVNVTNGTIVKEIAVGSSPERMIKAGGKVFVANSGYEAGATPDKSISIIDIATQTVSKTLQGDCFSPFAFAKESESYVWALYQGVDHYNGTHEPSGLVKIDVAAGTIVKSVPLYTDKHPSNLAISQDKKTLVVGTGYGFPGLIKYDLATLTLATTPFIAGDFYGFNVNPQTGEVIAFTTDYNSPNVMTRYDINGEEIKSYTVGYLGNGASFKKRSN